MNTSTNSKIVKLATSVLALLMIGFVNLAQAATAGPAFDHSKTGFVLKDVHLTIKCEQCHVDGIFKNTPKDCAGCHAIGTRVSAKPKPINHVPTTAACDTCHISAANFLVKSFNHVGITGGCVTCHNGQSFGVKSKALNHFPTNLPCESCHRNTSTFLSWSMDHTGITSGCASCHQGQFAGVVGLPPVHIPIPAGIDCGTCHATPPPGGAGSFLGAKYDHTTAVPAVAGNCNSCHTGAYTLYGVKGLSGGHIPTAGAQCDTCHTSFNTSGYTSFLGSLYHQNGATVPPVPPSGGCFTCHTGAYVGVQGTSFYAPHSTITSLTTCETCHTSTNTSSYTTFLGVVFDAAAHATAHIVSPSSPTGKLACATCHNGTTAQTFIQPHVAVNTSTTACDVCHTTSVSTMSWLGATFVHPPTIVSPSAAPTGANACGTCHNGTTAQTFVPPHIAVNINTTKCDSCHTTALSTLSWLGATFNHTAAGVASPGPTTGALACSTCHNGSTAQTYVQPHAVVNNATTTCASCHTTAMSTYSWLGATFQHPSGLGGTTTVQGVGPSCISCHGPSGPAATWVAPHAATPAGTACESCHTTALATLSWLGATFNHASQTPAIVSPSSALAPATNACGTCHFTGGTAQTYIQPHAIITPSTTTCDVCHTTALATASWLGASFNHAAYGVASPGPLGTTGLACAACHNGTNAQTYVQPHVTVNSALTTCASCHTTAMSTYSWLGAAFTHPSTVVSPSANPPPDVNACGTCHNGVTASTFVAPHAGAFASATMTSTSKCDDCHTNALTSLSWTSMTLTMAGLSGTGTFVHTDVSGYPAACSTCHTGTYAQGKPTTHLVTSATCDSCHTTALATLSWLGAVGVDHTANPFKAGTVSVTTAVGNCALCHNGTIAKGLSAGHIPVGSLSCDNSGCHVIGSASSFAPGVMGATQHSAIVGTVPLCSTCHNGSYASQGLSLGGAVGMVTNHIPTTSITPGLDCTTCHKNGFVAAAGAAGWVTTNGQMNHNGAQGGGSGGYCVTCHLSGVTYMGQAQKKNHNGSSTAKDCSSSSCHKPLGKTGSAYSNWGG